MITFHAILARRHGSIKAEPVRALFEDAGYDLLYAEFQKFKRDESLRAQFAEAILIRNLDTVDETHAPDPAQTEAARKSKELTVALKAHADLQAARAAADAANAQAADAKAAIKSLTPEQKTLVDNHLAAAAKAEAAARAAYEERTVAALAPVSAELKRQAAAGAENAARGSAIAAADTAALTLAAPSAYEAAKAGLMMVSAAALQRSADNYRVNIDGKTREEAIDLILTASGHKPTGAPADPVIPPLTGVRADIAKLSNDDLAKAAAEYEVDPKSFPDRDSLIEAIATAAGYK